MKKFLEIAQFTKPQGLHGGLRAKIFCDTPDILKNFEQFYMGESKIPTKVTVAEIRKGFVVLTVEDIDNAVTAGTLVGEILYIDRADYDLPEGSWFIGDLIGLQVVDADTGEIYGKVAEILQNAPKDVYVIKTPPPHKKGKILMFPSIPEVLISVDITAGKISIRPLEGLFDND